ncbi:MAG: hypothetical protein AAF713_22195 [Pseudomonadota bacterium]
MGAVTIQVAEDFPASYPTVSGVTDASAAWQRLEAHLSYRWGERSVTFHVEGPGEWSPPLVPFTLSLAEVWQSGVGWVSYTPDLAPQGWDLCGHGPYRFSGTLGSTDTPPEAVAEAVRRLDGFWATMDQERAASIEASDGDYSERRISGWQAKALQLSGAADLLRPWRRP